MPPSSDRKLRVLFLSRSLNRGGAERQLVALATGLHARGWLVSVACFYTGGAFQTELERAGVPVIDLHKRGRWDLVGFVMRLLRVFREADADIVHGYLPVANMLALVARLVRGNVRVVWGVRASNIDLKRYDWLSRLSFRASCRLSGYADLVIANSSAGYDYHSANGYPRGKMVVVPNGIDTKRFHFDSDRREKLRQQWNVAPDEVLVCLAGRLDPMKDHPMFITAAAQLNEQDSKWRFICVGGGDTDYANRLRANAQDRGLAKSLIWEGEREDMPAVYSAADIVVSTSYGEGFSNIIAEAMACGRPCVVTDVGDSAEIVGETGIVIPPHDSHRLVIELERCRKLRTKRGCVLIQSSIRKVQEFYSIKSLCDRTAFLLEKVVDEPRIDANLTNACKDTRRSNKGRPLP